MEEQIVKYVVISGCIKLSNNVILPERIALDFTNYGMIENSSSGEITIQGNDTILIAPIKRIFGDNIKITGTWRIEKAYPQWFYDDSDLTPAQKAQESDWAPAINMAINMIKNGTVFLPKGYYYIRSTIMMKYGIHLVGEPGSWKLDVSTGVGVGNTMSFSTINGVDYKDVGTVILSAIKNETKTEQKDYSPIYALMVNMTYDTEGSPFNVVFAFAPQGTEVKNIYFVNIFAGYYNKQTYPMRENYHYVYGALSSGGVKFDNVKWRYFRQALKFFDDPNKDSYGDAKEVVNCYYIFEDDVFQELLSDGTTIPESLYAFDMGYHGDALLFKHNTIHDGYYNKGLKVNFCGGALITDNIINADIFIRCCKGITFSSNHIEYGHQITIISSQVDISSNYIEKRDKTPFILLDHFDGPKNLMDKNVINLRDNIIVYINEFANSVNAYENGINSAKYDIFMGRNTILKLSNCYRYAILRETFQRMRPTGILIGKNEENAPGNTVVTQDSDFKEFNDYSYFMSRSCIVGPFFKISNSQFDIPELNKISIIAESFLYSIPLKWYNETGTYRYMYQIIWDKERKITKVKDNSNIFPIYINGSLLKEISENENIQFTITDGDEVGCCATIRLIRNKYSSSGPQSTSWVDIPICGTNILIDNGRSVNGYTWSSFDNSVNINSPIDKVEGIESIKYFGDNIYALLNSNNAITSGNWKRGDVLANVGNDTSWEIKIIK